MLLAETKKRTLLIIDDNITNLKVAVEYLQAYSFEILTARNGETGLERAQLAQPDLILLDVQMPGIDGFETCRRLKANPTTATTPVIFMTVHSETEHKVRGLEAGAVDYVTKPLEAAEVLARVNIHLKLRALQEQLQQANSGLEDRVRERTAALAQEIDQRKQQQAEKEELLEIVRQQSAHLRTLTQLHLEHQAQRQGQALSSHQQVDQDLGLLETCLKHAQQLLAEPTQAHTTADLALAQLENALNLLAHARHQSQTVGATLDQATSEQTALRTNPLLNLSDREYEVFLLLVQGKSNQQIGEALFLAKTTVSTYRKRVLEKLGVEDLSALVKIALQYNLIAAS